MIYKIPRKLIHFHTLNLIKFKLKSRRISMFYWGDLSVADIAQKAHFSTLSLRYSQKRNIISETRKYNQKKPLIIPKTITAKDLAQWMHCRFADMTSKAKISLGIRIDSPNKILDYEMASLIAMEYDFEPKNLEDEQKQVIKIEKRPVPSDEERMKWPKRAPVVTIMGHIDHGKTLTLDSIRKTSVVSSEAGGITQHIGAFCTNLPSGEKITFIDTPGHALFTSMRARGAHVTDIVVLMVAADDGIMPQTVEAINHSIAAKVPIIVAINKCDKPTADPDKVMRQLTDHNLYPEEYGGDVQCVQISALTGKGLDNLEEAILTQAELMDLRGDPSGMVESTVIEAKLAKGVGTIATVLIQRGTIKPNSFLVFGNGKSYVRVRRLIDDKGKALKQAGPSVPCEIVGAWTGIPQSGDEAIQVKNEAEAKKYVQMYKEKLDRLQQLQNSASSHRHVDKNSFDYKVGLFERKKAQLLRLKSHTNTDLYHQVLREVKHLEKELRHIGAKKKESQKSQNEAAIKNQTLNLVVKADVNGSEEAVVYSLQNLGKILKKRKSEISKGGIIDDFDINILHSSVGPITQSDIELLAAANKSSSTSLTSNPNDNSQKSALVAFNLPQPKALNKVIQDYRIPVIQHNVIYKLLDDIKDLVSGMLTPDFKYQVVGECQVMALFKVKSDNIAGCRVTEGTLYRAASSFDRSKNDEDIKYRVLRDDIKLYEGYLKSMKHHKDDVSKITSGMECGLSFGDNFKDLKIGDIIQCVHEVQLPPKLD